MTRVLKPGRSGVEKAADAAQVKATVEEILAQVELRGDAAVRELSVKFDNGRRTVFDLPVLISMPAWRHCNLASLTTFSLPKPKYAASRKPRRQP